MARADDGHCFPDTVPAIDITASHVRLGPIDCRELQWWFAVPEIGCASSSAWYEVDTGSLDFVRDVVSTAPTSVNGEDAVELVIRERGYGEARTEEAFRFACSLDEDRARWLAVTMASADGSTTATTVADEDLESQWGQVGPRRLVDSGRYELLPDGSYHMTGADDLGAGVYMVTVGDNCFTCLRVLDLPEAREDDEIGEAFVEPGGRTILYRQYRGRAYDDDWAEWRDAHPGAEIRIDGALYLHRDCTGRAHVVLTDAAFDATLAIRRGGSVSVGETGEGCLGQVTL